MKRLELDLPELPYAVEEAMNRLRVNIKFSGLNTRKILVTSTFPNEGKSTVVVNLWRMMAEAGFKSVLVDVDLRKTVLKNRHKFNTSKEDPGIDYYLSGLAEYNDILYETNIPNGYIIPVTTTLENPIHLLEDKRFIQLLDRLADEFRYVIIDSPPLNSVSDGSLIASRCDGALLVVRCGVTPRREIRNSLQQIERAGCPLIGTILNRAEVHGSAYYKYYHKYNEYYHYYYYKSDESGDKK